MSGLQSDQKRRTSQPAGEASRAALPPMSRVYGLDQPESQSRFRPLCRHVHAVQHAGPLGLHLAAAFSGRGCRWKLAHCAYWIRVFACRASLKSRKRHPAFSHSFRPRVAGSAALPHASVGDLNDRRGPADHPRKGETRAPVILLNHHQSGLGLRRSYLSRFQSGENGLDILLHCWKNIV